MEIVGEPELEVKPLKTSIDGPEAFHDVAFAAAAAAAVVAAAAAAIAAAAVAAAAAAAGGRRRLCSSFTQKPAAGRTGCGAPQRQQRGIGGRGPLK